MRRNIRFAGLVGVPLLAILIAVIAITSGWFQDKETTTTGDGVSVSNVQHTGGASNPSVPAAINAVPNGAAPSSVQQQAPATGTLDDTFVAVAQNAPGFGGLYYDDNGKPTIYVQDPAQADAAKASVRATLGS